MKRAEKKECQTVERTCEKWGYEGTWPIPGAEKVTVGGTQASEVVVVKLSCIRISWRACLNTHCGSSTRGSDSVGSRWGLIICISNKFPSDAYAAGLEITLRKPLI